MNVLELENSIDSSILTKEFINRLSNKPYCSNDLDYGLQIRNKETALARKYIQANTPFNLSWLCFDIDYPCVLETTFREKTLPTPNFMIVNPKNHHSHLLYGIDKMVHLTDNSSIDPIRYAHSVEIALRDELKADIGYTGLIIKNPQHEQWITQELNQNLWSLGELADYLALPNKIPKKELSIGLGRNCTLFELGRHFAYSQVLSFKITNTKENFYNLILNYLEQQNNNFPVPLQFSEYKAIAKSISNWTWKHYGNRSGKDWIYYVKKTHSVELQSWRGKQNTPEQQSIKGKKNTSEQQSIKGQLGGLKNTKEHLIEIGKLGGLSNTSEQQSLKGKKGSIKSAQIRFEGSNEQLKPWETLGISRRTYYYRQSKGLI